MPPMPPNWHAILPPLQDERRLICIDAACAFLAELLNPAAAMPGKDESKAKLIEALRPLAASPDALVRTTLVHRIPAGADAELDKSIAALASDSDPLVRLMWARHEEILRAARRRFGGRCRHLSGKTCRRGNRQPAQGMAQRRRPRGRRSRHPPGNHARHGSRHHASGKIAPPRCRALARLCSSVFALPHTIGQDEIRAQSAADSSLGGARWRAGAGKSGQNLSRQSPAFGQWDRPGHPRP